MVIKSKSSEDSMGGGSRDNESGTDTGSTGLRKRLFFARGRSKKNKTEVQASVPTATSTTTSSSTTPKASTTKAITIREAYPESDQTPVISNKSGGALVSKTTTVSSPAASSSAAPTAPLVRPKKGILKNKSEETPTGAAAPKRTTTTTQQARKKAAWFCRTAYFTKLCDTAFDVVDADHSGCVDVTELYSGLLLIHLKLGTYAGPAACRPLSRDRCRAIFEKMDADHSGTLDRDEFRSVMMVLFSNVVLRVLVQWSMTLMIVPLVAKMTLDALLRAVMWGFNFVATLDEDYELADDMEMTMEAAWDKVVRWSPEIVVRHASNAYYYLSMIPPSVWEALPLTILSTILGIVVVPWCIFQVDDFFQTIADRRAAKALRANAGPWI